MSEPTGYGPDYYKSESELRAELAAKDARIAEFTVVLNRLANATRFTSDQTLRAVHKVTTEVLGNAYEPFDVKMP